MPSLNPLPVSLQSDLEKNRSWEGITTPHDLALYMSRVLFIDPSRILALNEIIYSDVTPTGLDAKKIWIKTDIPVGIGIPTGDGYSMLFQYPPDVPVLWTKGISEIPAYMRQITEAELLEMGITAPTNTDYAWVIYNL